MAFKTADNENCGVVGSFQVLGQEQEPSVSASKNAVCNTTEQIRSGPGRKCYMHHFEPADSGIKVFAEHIAAERHGGQVTEKARSIRLKAKGNEGVGFGQLLTANCQLLEAEIANVYAVCNTVSLTAHCCRKTGIAVRFPADNSKARLGFRQQSRLSAGK